MTEQLVEGKTVSHRQGGFDSTLVFKSHDAWLALQNTFAPLNGNVIYLR